MCWQEFRRGFFFLAAGVSLAASSGALAQPAPAMEVVCVPSPSGDGPVWYNQGFYWGGYQYPAGGYAGAPYRPRAYSAADVYVSPPACFLEKGFYERTARRAPRAVHRSIPRRRCACPKH